MYVTLQCWHLEDVLVIGWMGRGYGAD